MIKDIILPHGWMQKDIDRSETADEFPEEEYSFITNIDDTGTLLRYNPYLKDITRERMQHMASGSKFWSKKLEEYYFDDYLGDKNSALPKPPEKDYLDFITYALKHLPEKIDHNLEIKDKSILNFYKKNFNKKFELVLADSILEKALEKIIDNLSFQEELAKEARSKARPPKKWFEETLKEIMKKNPTYTKEQAQATVGALWYNKMKPHKKTELKKKYYPERYARIVKKAMNKLANPLISDMGKEVLPLLQEALKAEFMQWDLYYAYKSQLKGLVREPIAQHFADHASEEAAHIEILQRFIVAMGEVPTTERRPIPVLKNNNIREIINLQLTFEIEAVDLYKKILSMLTDYSYPLIVEIEGILAQETEHMHDLQLLLRE